MTYIVVILAIAALVAYVRAERENRKLTVDIAGLWARVQRADEREKGLVEWLAQRHTEILAWETRYGHLLKHLADRVAATPPAPIVFPANDFDSMSVSEADRRAAKARRAQPVTRKPAPNDEPVMVDDDVTPPVSRLSDEAHIDG